MVARAFRDEPIEIWGDGTVARDFIFVDDVVDALVAAAHDAGTTRIFNIGSGEGHCLPGARVNRKRRSAATFRMMF